MEWYTKAVNQDHTDAQNNLGYMYDTGQCVRQNRSKATELYGKACDNGNEMGCDNYRRLNQQCF